MIHILVLLAIGLFVAGCTRETPAPVRYGETETSYVAPLPDEPPIPSTKPPVPGEEPDGTFAYGGASISGSDDLIAWLEKILQDESDTDEREPERVVTVDGEVPVIIVRAGDTLYGLSRSLGVLPRDLARINELESPYLLLVGQQLRVPVARDVPELQQASAETPDEIADSNASTSETAAVVEPPEDDQFVAVDAASDDSAQTTDSTTREESTDLAATETSSFETATSVVTETAETESAYNVVTVDYPASGFIWPVVGEVISTFGPKDGGRQNDGVNIKAPAGTPVRASEDGIVAYVGDGLRGYGKVILLRHADGWVTVYGHNARNLVVHGQSVLRGDVIAQVGASGGVPVPQSHFELRQGTVAVDPQLHIVGG